MKKIITQFSVILLLSLIGFGILEKNNLKIYNYITLDTLNLFFTAITVLFPIGMSIAIGIDFSKVINKKKRTPLVFGLKQTIHSFCLYFIADCAAMLIIVVIKQINKKTWQTHFIYILSVIIIVFSIFYFLYNFIKMFNFKRDLEERIFEELQDN